MRGSTTDSLPSTDDDYMDISCEEQEEEDDDDDDDHILSNNEKDDSEHSSDDDNEDDPGDAYTTKTRVLPVFKSSRRSSSATNKKVTFGYVNAPTSTFRQHEKGNEHKDRLYTLMRNRCYHQTCCKLKKIADKLFSLYHVDTTSELLKYIKSCQQKLWDIYNLDFHSNENGLVDHSTLLPIGIVNTGGNIAQFHELIKSIKKQVMKTKFINDEIEDKTNVLDDEEYDDPKNSFDDDSNNDSNDSNDSDDSDDSDDDDDDDDIYTQCDSRPSLLGQTILVASFNGNSTNRQDVSSVNSIICNLLQKQMPNLQSKMSRYLSFDSLKSYMENYRNYILQNDEEGDSDENFESEGNIGEENERPKKKRKKINAHSFPIIAIFWNQIESFEASILEEWLYCCASRIHDIPIVNILFATRQDVARKLLLKRKLLSKVSAKTFRTSISEKRIFYRLFDKLFLSKDGLSIKPGAQICHFFNDYFLTKCDSAKNFVNQCQYLMLNHYNEVPTSFLANLIFDDDSSRTELVIPGNHTIINQVLHKLSSYHLGNLCDMIFRHEKNRKLLSWWTNATEVIGTIKDKLFDLKRHCNRFNLGLDVFTKIFGIVILKRSKVTLSYESRKSSLESHSEDSDVEIEAKVSLYLWIMKYYHMYLNSKNTNLQKKGILNYEPYQKLEKQIISQTITHEVVDAILRVWKFLIDRYLWECGGHDHFLENDNDTEMEMKEQEKKLNDFSAAISRMLNGPDTNYKKSKTFANGGKTSFDDLGPSKDTHLKCLYCESAFEENDTVVNCKICNKYFHLSCDDDNFVHFDEEIVIAQCKLCRIKINTPSSNIIVSQQATNANRIKCETCKKLFEYESVDLTKEQANRIAAFFCPSCRMVNRRHCKDSEGNSLYCSCYQPIKTFDGMTACITCNDYYHYACLRDISDSRVEKASPYKRTCPKCIKIMEHNQQRARRKKSIVESQQLNIDIPSDINAATSQQKKQHIFNTMLVVRLLQSFFNYCLVPYSKIPLHEIFWAEPNTTESSSSLMTQKQTEMTTGSLQSVEISEQCGDYHRFIKSFAELQIPKHSLYNTLNLDHDSSQKIEWIQPAIQLYEPLIPRLHSELMLLLKRPEYLFQLFKYHPGPSSTTSIDFRSKIDICAAYTSYQQLTGKDADKFLWLKYFSHATNMDPTDETVQARFWIAAKSLKFLGITKRM